MKAILHLEEDCCQGFGQTSLLCLHLSSASFERLCMLHSTADQPRRPQEHILQSASDYPAAFLLPVQHKTAWLGGLPKHVFVLRQAVKQNAQHK